MTPKKLRQMRAIVGVGALIVGAAAISMLMEPRAAFDVVTGVASLTSLLFLVLIVFTSRVDDMGRISFGIPLTTFRLAVAVIVAGAVAGCVAAVWQAVASADTTAQVVVRVSLSGLIGALAVILGVSLGRRIRKTETEDQLAQEHPDQEQTTEDNARDD